MKELPHFDCILTALDHDHAEARHALGRHFHFGYWETPEAATGTAADFAEAAERLCSVVCVAAGVQDGQRVLDIGCGLGGTLASIDERFDGMALQGLNIDPSQLKRAQGAARPTATNRVDFALGDACAPPFRANVFDVVVSIECLLYSPRRAELFHELRRVLREGGRLVVADFVSSEFALPVFHASKRVVDLILPRHTNVDLTCTLSYYRQLAQQSGFRILREFDVTRNIKPSLPFLRRLVSSISRSRADLFHTDLHYRYGQWLVDLGMVRYVIMVLQSAPHHDNETCASARRPRRSPPKSS